MEVHSRLAIFSFMQNPLRASMINVSFIQINAQAESCHRRGPKTVPAQTAEMTKCHVIFIVFFKF